MFSSAWIFDRLLEAAASSFVLFTVGTLAVLCCRQPVRRARLIALTLAGSVVVPVLNLLAVLSILPGLPHWSLPEIGTIAALKGARLKEQRQQTTAPVQLADSQSIDEPSLGAAEAHAESGDTTGRTELISEDHESSAELQPAPSLVDRRGFLKTPAPATRTIPAADGRSLSAIEVSEQPAPASATAASVLPTFAPTAWLVTMYFAGGAALAAWWVLGIGALWRLLRTARPAPEWCRTSLREIAGPAGDNVRLLVSSRAAQPFTFGWYRPVIVLPEDMTIAAALDAELDAESQPSDCSSELRWSLAHEWSHVARGMCVCGRSPG
jgi:hypothetical protein